MPSCCTVNAIDDPWSTEKGNLMMEIDEQSMKIIPKILDFNHASLKIYFDYDLP